MARFGVKLILDGQRVIDDGTYSAIVIMVMVTTLVTPSLLIYSMTRADKTKGQVG